MKRKIIFSVIISVIIVVSMSIGAFAASNLQEIKAYLNKGLKFELQGKSWTAKDENEEIIYPITYNNTTYLPVRAVAEATGLEVGWNQQTQTVILGGEGGGQTGKTGGTSSETGVGNSRSNPAPIGKEVSFSIDDILLGKVEGSLKIEEVIRGDEAWKRISAANMFNGEPQEGFEYVLAKIAVKVDSIEKQDAQFSVSPVSFTLVSSAGKDYGYISVVAPDPEIRADLYAGASHTGWAAFQVSTEDETPLLTFGRKFDGTGGVWFKTQ